jgi:hypothetical protein
MDGKRFADDEEVETEVRKWLRKQLKDFYVASFDALVKRWGKSRINVLSRFEYHMFYVLYSFVTYLLNLRSSFFQFHSKGLHFQRQWYDWLLFSWYLVQILAVEVAFLIESFTESTFQFCLSLIFSIFPTQPIRLWRQLAFHSSLSPNIFIFS